MLIQLGRYAEADEVLDGIDVEELTFNDHRFRFAVSQARVSSALGEHAVAREFAELALELTEVTEPEYGRHPTVGLVKADRRILRELRKLASASPHV
jgi:hypothetical protein